MSKNAFEALCEVASRGNWCWDLRCTTCGCLELRYGLYQLSIGVYPGHPNWRGRSRREVYEEMISWRELPDVLGRSLPLQDILVDANISNIAKSCKFPGYLGIMGFALNFTAPLEELNRRITMSWGPQLREMVNEGSQAQEIIDARLNTEEAIPMFLFEPAHVLTWKMLTQVKLDMKPEYREGGLRRPSPGESDWE